MSTPIRIKRSSQPGKRPTTEQLQLGELAFNFNDGHLYSKRDTAGVGIGTTTALLTPWLENFGGASIYYDNAVGIGSTQPTSKLDVDGDVYIASNLVADGTISFTGISTFNSDVDINASVDISDHLVVNGNLNVVGLSTFGSDVDINANVDISGYLDVDGHTELDNINVSGVSTFVGVGTFQNDLYVGGDLYVADDIVFDEFSARNASLSGNLEVSGVSTFTGAIDANGDLDVDGHTELDNLNVSGVATFAQNVEITGNLTVNGTQTILNTTQLEVEDINIGIASADPKLSNAALDGAGITIYGAAGDKTLTWNNADSRMEFNTDLHAPNISSTDLTLTGDLDVDGHTELDNVNISGVTTFASSADFNASIDVDGHTELDDLNVSGVSTFASAVDINADLDVDGRTELDATNISETLNVVGVSTFASDIDINASIDVDGHTELDNLNVSGVSTFAGAADFNGGVDVLGHTELDTLNVSVATTTASLTLANAGVAVTAILDEDGLTSDRADALATQQSIKAYVDAQVTAQDLDFAGDTGTGAVDLDSQTFSVFGTPNEIETAAAGQSVTIGLPSNVTITNQLDVGGGLAVTGVTTLSSNVDINADIDVDGHTELDNVNISGVTTFAGAIDANGDLDVDGFAELDAVNISQTLSVTGISTFSSDVDINAGLDVDGHTELDNLNVSGVSTFAGAADFNGNIDVDGHTELDDVNVTGVSTFQSDVFLGDNNRLRLGDSQDFQIYHDSTTSQSRIEESGGGSLIIKGTDLYLQTGAGENILFGDANGAVNLYYDATKKFETTGYGVTIYNELRTPNLNVSGASTFTGAADFNGGLVANEATVEDLADNSVVIAGAGGRLEDDANLTFDGSTLSVGVDLDVDGHTELDQLRVVGVSTFAGNVDISAGGNLTVAGNLTVNGTQTILNTSQLEVEDINIGIASADPKLSNAALDGAGITIHGAAGDKTLTWSNANSRMEFNTDLYAPNIDSTNITLSGDLDVDGHTELDNLNVSGVSTFAGAIDANGDLDVDGHTELDNVNISGVTTFAGAIDANGDLDVDGFTELDAVNVSQTLSVVGISTFSSSVDINADIDVDGHTELDNLNVSGVSTFASTVDIDSDLDVDGFTELDAVNVSQTLSVVGLSTFGSDVDINASIDVSGHTELDTLNVSVATTTASLTLANAGVAVTAILDEDGLTSDRADALATQQSIKAYVDAQVTAQDLDFAGDTGTGAVDLDSQSLTISGTANEIETSATGQTLTVGLPNEVAITTSLTVGSATTITGSGIIAGIVTGTLDNTLTLATSGTGLSGSATYDNSGASTFTVTSNATDANTGGTIVARDGSGNFSAGTISADLTGVASTATKLETARDFSVSGDVATSSGVSFDGTGNVDLAVTLSNTFSANTSGIITSTGGFVGDLTGVASTATKLETARDFSITGSFVTASAVSFDGTGNVALGATITPDSITLGTYTSGDYVESITGTANEVEVTGGSGEGSTPQIGLPANVTISNDLIVSRDVQINRDLNVTGNITIGGTTATLFTETLTISDAEIVLGFRTDAFDNDASNDTTANHGGIAVASTEGTPLVRLVAAGIETLPPTYKKILWFKQGTFSGLGTDAWLINYAVGIGSTQFPSGTRLAAGSVQFTENDLAVVRNINASGIITGTLDNTLTLATSGNGLSGSATYDNSGAATFTVTSDATSANTADTIVYRDSSGNFSAGTITANLSGNVTGDLTGVASTATKLETARDFSVSGDVATSSPVSFDGTGNVDLAVTLSNTFSANTSGIITSSGGFVGNLTGTATTATNLADGANITTGTISDDRLPDLITSNINITTGVSTVGTLDANSVTADSLSVSGVSTFQGDVYLGDNDRLMVGAGSDLQIYHNSSNNNSIISETGPGNLIIGGDNNVEIKNTSGTETKAKFITDGAVELYYDNSKKFETTGYGVTVFGGLNVSGVSTFQGNVDLGDNDRLRLGDGNDLQIYHNGSTSYITDVGSGELNLGGSVVNIRNAGQNELRAAFYDNKVELYYDNSKKFETTGFGATVFGGLLVSGITTYTDTTDNTLGDADTGAFQIDGGLGVNKNVTVGGGLDIGATLNVSGVSTFSDDVILQSNLNVTGVTTASSFVKSGGTSSEFLKADGTVDSNTYLTSYTETQTLDDVLTLGNVSGIGISVGVATASSFVKSGGTSSQFLKADGSVDSNTYLTAESDTLDDVTSRGNSTTNGISVGIATASSFVKTGGTSSQFLKADGSVDSNTYLTAESQTLDGILTLGNTSALGMSVGVVTATSFVKSGGTSSQFLKADGTVDSSTYLTSYTETQTIGDVLALGNVTGIGMSVGVVTATAFVGDGSGITNLPASTIGINTNTTNLAQLIPFAVSYGSTTGLGATDGLVYNPSSGRMGIGSDAPAYTLDVAGDINSSTDVKINGTGVLDTALALAIALG